MYFFVQILLRILLSVVRNTFRNSSGSIKIIKAYNIIQDWTQDYLFLNYSLPRIRQFLENSLPYHFLVDDDAVITNLSILLPPLPPLSINSYPLIVKIPVESCNKIWKIILLSFWKYRTATNHHNHTLSFQTYISKPREIFKFTFFPFKLNSPYQTRSIRTKFVAFPFLKFNSRLH